MTNVISFRSKPRVVVEHLGHDHSGAPVYSSKFVDAEGCAFTDYLGPSYIDAMLNANEWLEPGVRFVDRTVEGEARR